MSQIIQMKPMFKSNVPSGEVSHQAMEICEHVISEIGAEVHDDLMQKLSIFRLYLDRLDRAKSDPSAIASLIISMNADFSEVVQSVRRISRQLHPVKMGGEPLGKCIAMLCQNMERPGTSTIHLETTGQEQPI